MDIKSCGPLPFFDVLDCLEAEFGFQSVAGRTFVYTPQQFYDEIRKVEQRPEVVFGILSCWYTKELGLPVKVKNVIYMEEFFKLLEIQITREEYYSVMKEFGKVIK